MQTTVRLTHAAIPDNVFDGPSGTATGAEVIFLGRVRDMENGTSIRALRYEAYESMAILEIERIIPRCAANLQQVQQVDVIHRLGDVPAGEASIAVRVCSAHRREAFAFLAEFMDRLKEDVPVWKTRSIV